MKKRVCVVGAGAAGMACAWSLGRFPEKFEVEVWEANDKPGGVATSDVVRSKDGKEFPLNDQVQGGAPSYRNNLLLFAEHGFDPSPVTMMICFGKGEHAWTNHSDSKLTQQLRQEIARFERALKWIHRLEPFFVFVSISKVLRWWGFSAEFADHMVFPLTALFFGTGNQTPYVSAAVIARVFLDKELALFKYSPERLLDGAPDMFAFPNLEKIFTSIAAAIPARVYCNRAVKSVERPCKKGGANIVVTDTNGEVGHFDEIVFTCDTETTRRVLGKGMRWLEKKLLGNVKYFDDLIVTHEDEEYMRKEYEMTPGGNDMYFIRTDPEDRKRVEMSFNLCHYQPHLKDAGAKEGRNVYQTIFLDKNGEEHWTYDDIKKDTILKERWTRQFAHTWTHFASWVPFVRFLQGRKHTWYAGAVTLFNTHEVAVMSGLAVAHRLGAPYPFAHDALAMSQMRMYMKIVHGVNLREKDCSPAGTSHAPSRSG